MFFKNLLIYRFTGQFQIAANLEELLAAAPFVPCGSQDMTRAGWTAPMPDGELLSHTTGACTLLCLRKQQKILPGAAVAEALEEKVRQIETNESRKVYRKERKQLKEEVLITLAPRALTRSSRTYAYIDIANQWLIVNSSSRSGAEELLTQLRNDIGSLPLVPLETYIIPVYGMTNWLRQRPPTHNFALGEQCDLRDVQESSNTVKVRDQDLLSDEVLQHIEAGKQVTRIELCWHEAIDFVLGDDLTIRRLKFRDEVLERIDNLDDARAQFDQEFSVMTIETGRFVSDLISAFGGIQNQ